jgi:preprotein translocase subunit SecG
MNFMYYLCVTLFVLVCVFLMLLILIQKGRGGGLASAFGGGGGNTAFGSKTGDVLTWATSIVFGVFIVLAVALNLIANSIHANRPGATTRPAVVETEVPLPNNPPAAGEPGVIPHESAETPPPATPAAVEAGAPAEPAPTTQPR